MTTDFGPLIERLKADGIWPEKPVEFHDGSDGLVMDDKILVGRQGGARLLLHEIAHARTGSPPPGHCAAWWAEYGRLLYRYTDEAPSRSDVIAFGVQRETGEPTMTNALVDAYADAHTELCKVVHIRNQQVKEKDELLEWALGLICNATSDNPEWVDGAKKWQDRYYAQADFLTETVDDDPMTPKEAENEPQVKPEGP